MASTRRISADFFEARWVDKLVADGEPQYVLLFIYLIVTCRNPVGIFELNPRTWNFKLNPPTPFIGEEVFIKYGKRVRRIDGHPDKGIIVGFCDFQNSFGRKSSQWQWVEKDLAAVGLTYDDLKHFDEEATQPELELGVPPPLSSKAKPPTETPQRNIIPPLVEWVAAYCAERRNGIDAQHFWDWYETKGWKVGSQKMKDWQAAVRTWEKRDEEKPKPTTPTAPVKQVIGVRRKF